MPRQPRIDIPGLLQHVIVRGIERSEIFLDDEDRQHFVDRFSQLLVETGTDCFAWALIPNHFHLLLRCVRITLSGFMRRLLTGYAVYFNRRHSRSGHLFQNRYKSIVCEEEPYFLELVRYIHLNPLRAGLLAEIEELDGYPWCGHAIVMGQQNLPGQSVEAVLERFGKTMNASRRRYRQFIADGLAPGKLGVTPACRLSANQPSEASGEKSITSDDRILGGSEFVEKLLETDAYEGSLSPRMSMANLQESVADYFDVNPGSFSTRGRQNEPSFARSIFSYLAVKELRCSGVEVAQMLDVGASSVSRAVRRGEKLFLSSEELQEWWGNTLKQ